MKALKSTSELHKRILKADDYLRNLGISISYNPEGIVIKDTESGMEFVPDEPDFNFPLNFECKFILKEE